MEPKPKVQEHRTYTPKPRPGTTSDRRFSLEGLCGTETPTCHSKTYYPKNVFKGKNKGPPKAGPNYFVNVLSFSIKRTTFIFDHLHAYGLWPPALHRTRTKQRCSSKVYDD